MTLNYLDFKNQENIYFVQVSMIKSINLFVKNISIDNSSNPETELTSFQKFQEFLESPTTDEKLRRFANQKLDSLKIEVFKLFCEQKEIPFELPIDKDFLKKYCLEINTHTETHIFYLELEEKNQFLQYLKGITNSGFLNLPYKICQD